MPRNNIKHIKTQDVSSVTELHITGIPTGFISSLGIDFVMALYKAIAQSKTSFGFVAKENEEKFCFWRL